MHAPLPLELCHSQVTQQNSQGAGQLRNEPPDDGCAGAGMVGTPSCGPEPVPSGAVPEVAKVLQAASWYEVLEVAASASPEEIKRAHKLKSLGTHPDKVGAANNAGAHEASVRVNMVRVLSCSRDSGRRRPADMHSYHISNCCACFKAYKLDTFDCTYARLAHHDHVS